MNLSEDRQGHWVHLMLDKIWNDDLVDFTDEEAATRFAKKSLHAWLEQEANVDAKVRAKIQSLKRTVIEGSPEWDIMYRKYYDEETQKHGQK